MEANARMAYKSIECVIFAYKTKGENGFLSLSVCVTVDAMLAQTKEVSKSEAVQKNVEWEYTRKQS